MLVAERPAANILGGRRLQRFAWTHPKFITNHDNSSKLCSEKAERPVRVGCYMKQVPSSVPLGLCRATDASLDVIDTLFISS